MDLLLLFLLLGMSAAFSGTETAYFSLSVTELAKLAHGSDKKGSKVVRLLKRSHDLLSALLIGNLLINTAVGVLTTALCLRYFGARGVAIAVPAATVALLLFGEITPKMLALQSRGKVARTAEGPLRIWLIITGPLIKIIGTIMETVLNALPFDRAGSRPLTTDELQIACDLAVNDGTLSETEGRSLARLLLLEELEVLHIMTPRTEVKTLHQDMSLAQVLGTARRAGFNRYPVINPDTGKLVGVFHLKDLLQAGPERIMPLSGDLRPVLFVPESKDVAALLTEMRGGGAHLAAVVDEHGDFTGIVTMADCLQAFLGQVGDATGKGLDLVALGNNSWVIPGRLDLRELAEYCEIHLPESRYYVTVAGYLMASLGRVLVAGDKVETETGLFTVLDVTGHRIDRVQVTKWDPENIPAGSTEREQL